MKKLLNIIFILFILVILLISPKEIAAQTPINGCNSVGQCINNQKCIVVYVDSNGNRCLEPTCGGDPGATSTIQNVGGSCGSSEVGGVAPPVSILDLNRAADAAGSQTTTHGIGLLFFLSRLVNFAAIVAGLWVLFNIVTAGWLYVTKMGDSGAHQEVIDKVTYSVIGLAVIAMAYTLAAVVSLVFFGSPEFILNPQLYSAIFTP